MENSLKAQIEELRYKEGELARERWHLKAMLEDKKREGYRKLKQFLYDNKGKQFTLKEICQSAKIDEEVSVNMLAGYLCCNGYNRVVKEDNCIIASSDVWGRDREHVGDIKRVEVPLYDKAFKKKDRRGRIIGIVVPHQSYYYLEEK